MKEKPEVFTVFAQVRAPRGSDPGAAVEGAYVITDGVVHLTDRDGNPVRDDNGKLYAKKIANGDTAKVIASRLTKDFRNALRGKDNRVSGFGAPLQYPKPKTGRYFI
jgi:hypothetical protein